jgi:hypothetical protein
MQFIVFKLRVKLEEEKLYQNLEEKIEYAPTV